MFFRSAAPVVAPEAGILAADLQDDVVPSDGCQDDTGAIHCPAPPPSIGTTGLPRVGGVAAIGWDGPPFQGGQRRGGMALVWT